MYSRIDLVEGVQLLCLDGKRKWQVSRVHELLESGTTKESVVSAGHFLIRYFTTKTGDLRERTTMGFKKVHQKDSVMSFLVQVWLVVGR